MQQNNAVLVLRENEFIAFPGVGGYKMEWSPGTRLSPMMHAPSGQLVIPCDYSEELPADLPTTEDLSIRTDHFTSR